MFMVSKTVQPNLKGCGVAARDSLGMYLLFGKHFIKKRPNVARFRPVRQKKRLAGRYIYIGTARYAIYAKEFVPRKSFGLAALLDFRRYVRA